MINNNERRIAKNTLFLYCRMLISVWISLYTSRVILDILGVDDYGIYNIVGGVVAIFGFLNGSMSGATSRFLSFEIGVGDRRKLEMTFSTSFLIHTGIAVALFVLAETIGLWFVNSELVIAPERMAAANWTYQLSIATMMVTIIQIPFTASIMSHEKMDVYAYVSLLNVVLKLVIVLMLVFFPDSDKLVIYAVLFFVVALTVEIIYMVYCLRKFPECRLSFKYDKAILKAMVSFSGWDVYGSLCYTSRLQGSNIILNNFGGTVLNAAGGLAVTVSATLTSFASTVISAFRPQIIQQYARSNYGYMLDMLYNAAKYSCLLMGVLVVPMFIEMDYVLGLWLVDPPEYTSAFCRICLLATCAELVNYVVGIGIHATGRIARISFISGTIYLMELPAMYFLLRSTREPSVVYYVHLVFIYIVLLSNTLILKDQLRAFSAAGFWRKGVAAPMLIIVASAVPAYLVYMEMPESFLRLTAVSVVSAVMLGILTYFFALSGEIRLKVNDYVSTRIRRLL